MGPRGIVGVAACVAVLLGVLARAQVAAPAPAPPPTDVTAAMLTLHNAERAKAGLAPLAADPRLASASRGHASRMAEVRVLAHEGIGDGTPWTRMAAAGYAYSNASENLAAGGPVPVWNGRGWSYRAWSPAEAFAALWNSPPHRANILGPYRDLGAGSAPSSNGMVYYCLKYGTPAPPGPGPAPPTPPTPPAPDGPGDPLEVAAAAYGRVVPTTLHAMAEQIRSGRITHINEAVGLMETARAPVVAAFSARLDAVMRANADANGTITKPAPLADAVEAAAVAMERSRP